MTATVLIVDDDDAFRELVVDILSSEGHRLLEAADAEQAMSVAASEPIDLVLTDQRMPGLDGLELSRRLRASSRPPQIVLLSAYGTIPDAVQAMRLGAVDYLTKPLKEPDVLRRTVRSILERRRAGPRMTEEFITHDPEVLGVLALADRAAATDAPVLISGESGTGKELLARRIHRRSRRAAGPFVAVNCAAIPEQLAESQMFGHERGAFTGAQALHHGHFEQADGGTLFLDEVSELTAPVQAKLLRAVEQQGIRRVGGTRSLRVDVRLISATNTDLEQAVAAQRFRPDLFYRLRVMTLRLPPLRERASDLVPLVQAFRHELAEKLGVVARPFSPAALACLARHAWPGNVRELRNVIERSLIAATGEQVECADLPPELRCVGAEPDVPEERPLLLEERERQAILEALHETGGHRERAARLLGISVRTLYSRLKAFGIH
ncbi:MAG: sigma-54-dependent transcriptional regulator [Acidobacteriota bacterium]